MYQFPKQPKLLDMDNYNTCFTLKSTLTPIDFSAKLSGFNENQNARCKFTYTIPNQFILKNIFKQDKLFKINYKYIHNENITCQIISPNIYRFQQAFQVGVWLTFDQKYQFLIEWSKQSNGLDFYASNEYDYNDWSLKTIMQIGLLNEQWNFKRFIQLAKQQNKNILFELTPDQMKIQLETDLNEQSQLAFQMAKTTNNQTELVLGLIYKLNEKWNVISKVYNTQNNKLNNQGQGIIGFQTTWEENLRFYFGNKFNLNEIQQDQFPFQFRIDIQQS